MKQHTRAPAPKTPPPQVQLFRLSVENRKLSAELRETQRALQLWKERANRAQAIAQALTTPSKQNTTSL